MFFSVVIPAYNRSHVISRALESVRRQTFVDYECIVVDDGSADGDVLGAHVSAMGDDRFRLIRRDNGGAAAARNTGIDSAHGDYVAFLDSDDEFLDHHLAEMHAHLQLNPGTVAYSPVLVERGTGGRIVKPPYAMASGEHMATYLLCRRGFLPTTTLVVPRMLAQSVRYQDGLTTVEDTDFDIRLYVAGARFHMLDQPGGIWFDLPDPGRESARVDAATRLAWLDTIRPFIPERAYAGDLGWYVAKTLAQSGQRGRALGLFAQALAKGCYAPQLAATIALQILLPRRVYRAVADLVISMRGRRPGA